MNKYKSIFLANLHYFFAKTDGSYYFPNSAIGDLLKQAKKEIEFLSTIVQQSLSDYGIKIPSSKFECHNCGNDSHCHLIVDQIEGDVNEMLKCKWHSNFR